jgi:hypothetical protein
VFFASHRLVDWLSPETAGDWVIVGLVSGGTAAVAQAMQKIEEQAMLEANDIINWLQFKGIGEARNVALQLLSGQRIEWPFMALKWQTVGYFSQTFVADRPVTPERRVTHAAFVLIWSGNGGGQPIPPIPPPVPPQGYARTGQFDFVGSNGLASYIRLNDRDWIEKGSGLNIPFVTSQEAPAFVDLFDASRNLTIRLANDGGQFWTQGSGWNTLERGTWVTPVP